MLQWVLDRTDRVSIYRKNCRHPQLITNETQTSTIVDPAERNLFDTAIIAAAIIESKMQPTESSEKALDPSSTPAPRPLKFFQEFMLTNTYTLTTIVDTAVVKLIDKRLILNTWF